MLRGGAFAPHVGGLPFNGNRGWNGYHFHHPWAYLPYAYSIYPYTYGLALGSGYYDYGGGPPAYNVYNDYVYNDYQTSNPPPAAPYVGSYPPAAEYAPEAAPPPPAARSDSQFSAQAVAAFSAGNYEEAIRLADHALVDSPKEARTHELLSLAMFALGDYRGAAIEAHAAISLGPVGNWAGIQSYYNNPGTYSTQLRALESYVIGHPTAADAHFLLGYQYLMLSHTDAAKYQFQSARQLTPDDALAVKLANP
jgi:tetratricopeptide (TPR) repeat protein